MFKSRLKYIALALVLTTTMLSCNEEDYVSEIDINGSLKFEITAKRLYAASQRVL